MNTSKHERKEGVALIVVLGMLALLMIMAVAFAVTMRAERSGAGNFAYSVYSRHMLEAGLAHAIAAIDSSMRTSQLDMAVYPEWEDDVLPSGAGAAGSSVNIVWGDALKYIPSSLTNAAVSTNSVWIDAAEKSGVMGRFAYMAVNCSGLLDCNLVGGSNRWAGVHPRELVISNLADIADATRFFVGRGNDVRYETLPELHRLQGQGQGSNPGLRGLVASPHPASFVTYSLFPEGYCYYDSVDQVYRVRTNLVYIGGNEGQLQTRYAQITNALVISGISGSQADFVFRNLTDYIDADSVPYDMEEDGVHNDSSRPAGAYTESVPMINELIVEGAVTFDDGVARIPYRFRAEWFYPFIRASPHEFKVRMYGKTYARNISVPEHPSGDIVYFDEERNSGYAAGVDVNTYSAPSELQFIVTPSVEAEEGHKVALYIDVHVEVLLEDGITMVDAVPYPTNGPALMTFSNTWSVPRGPFKVGKECVDPRFNWNPNSPSWIYQNTAGLNPSIGGPNESMTLYLNHDPAYPGVEDSPQMFVANRNLLSVGELGNLLRGMQRPMNFFQTIRLYDIGHTRDKVLSLFSTQTDPARRGLINLNSPFPELIDCGLLGSPIRYPEAGTRVTPQEVLRIANCISTNGPYINVDEIGAFPWREVLDGRTDLERESVIAYSYQLFGTRQNLFVVILEAGPASRGAGRMAAEYEMATSWLSVERAVAVLWRDPFPDEEGQHTWLVRLYKRLDD